MLLRAHAVEFSLAGFLEPVLQVSKFCRHVFGTCCFARACLLACSGLRLTSMCACTRPAVQALTTACPGAGYSSIPGHLQLDDALATVQEYARKLKRAISSKGKDASSVSTADGAAIKAQLADAKKRASQAKAAPKLFNQQ